MTRESSAGGGGDKPQKPKGNKEERRRHIKETLPLSMPTGCDVTGKEEGVGGGKGGLVGWAGGLLVGQSSHT